jgi:hypothetical protein
MNLYLVERSDNSGYDEYKSFVACCSSLEEARLMHPNKDTEWSAEKNVWLETRINHKLEKVFGTNDEWPVHPNSVIVTLLGTALQTMEKQVVIASYDAG